MKLLIVDDEELTRTGVISSIDWPLINAVRSKTLHNSCVFSGFQLIQRQQVFDQLVHL